MNEEQEIREFLDTWIDKQTWLEKQQRAALLAVLDLRPPLMAIGEGKFTFTTVAHQYQKTIVKTIYTALFPKEKDA